MTVQSGPLPTPANLAPEVERNWPFVGREGEFRRFTDAMENDAVASIIVYGVAGVGKSRFAQQCADMAQARGHPVLRATATRAAQRIPLGALGHLLPPDLDLSQPMRAFQEVVRRVPSGARRTVFFVDDAHLLDTASVTLLMQMVDAGRVCLLVTVRDDAFADDATTAREVLEAIDRKDGSSWIDIDALSVTEVERLLRAALGAPVGHAAVSLLHRVSGGNPLYLRELTLGSLASRSLVKIGEVWDTGARVAHTPRLAQLITGRAARLDPEVREVLRFVAACGSVSPDDCAAQFPSADLAALERSGMAVVHIERRRATVRCLHPLYAEILLRGTSATALRRWRLDQARRLESYGLRRREDVVHASTLRLYATGHADPKALTQAARIARYVHDYRRVVQLVDAIPEDALEPEALLMLGDAYLQMGNHRSAEAAFRRACDLPADDDVMLELVRARVFNLFWVAADDQGALDMNRAALGAVPSEPARRMLLVAEAAMLALSGDPQRALDQLDENLEDDPYTAFNLDTWLFGAAMKTVALSMTGRTADARTWGAQGYRTHREVADRTLAPHPAVHAACLMLAHCDHGDFASAREAGYASLAALVENDALFPRLWTLLHLGRCELRAGHPVTARKLFAEALTIARGTGQIKCVHYLLSCLAGASAMVGDTGAARRHLAEREPYPRLKHLYGEDRAAAAWLLVAEGAISEAREELLDAAREARATGHLISEAIILVDVARLGGAPLVADRLAEIAATAQSPLCASRAAFVAALAAGDAERLLTLADEFATGGAHLLAAESACLAAKHFDRTGRPRRATAANTAARRHLAECQGTRSPNTMALSPLRHLTKRETEIALMTAAGSTNAEIAERLVLSVRTIENHLARVFHKVGASSRQELAQLVGEGRNQRLTGLTG